MLEQVAAVTLMNLKTLPTRFWSSLVIILGVAGVVGVLVSVLAMATGLITSMEHAGRADRTIVLRGGSDTETSSLLSRNTVVTILDAPGIRRDAAGEGIGSANPSRWSPVRCAVAERTRMLHCAGSADGVWRCVPKFILPKGAGLIRAT